MRWGKGTAMVAHAQYEIGNAARLVATGRQSMRSDPCWRRGHPASGRGLIAEPRRAPTPRGAAAFPSSPLEWTAKWARKRPQASQHRGQKSGMSIMAALLNMSNRRFFVFAAGITLLVGGLLALGFPVFLPNFDQWGFQINCGSGFRIELTQLASPTRGQANSSISATRP